MRVVYITDKKYGGPELGLLECALVSEALAYGCSGIQTAMEGEFAALCPY